MRHNWLSQHPFDGPSGPSSTLEGTKGNRGPDRPVGENQSVSAKLDKHVSSLISGLFGRGGPATVFRGIISIVVSPVNRMSRSWSAPHVCNEVFILHPSVADRNSASSVIAVWGSFVCWLEATAFHCNPATIFRRARVSVGRLSAFPIASFALHQVSALLAVGALRLRSLKTSGACWLQDFRDMARCFPGMNQFAMSYCLTFHAARLSSAAWKASAIDAGSIGCYNSISHAVHVPFVNDLARSCKERELSVGPLHFSTKS